jgi:hypothetical protein
MSKKLIAVASAAALALAGLVAIPTSVNAAVGPFAVSVTGTTSTTSVARDGSTSAKALQINVPSADVIRLEATGSTVAGASTAIKFDVVVPGATDTVTVTSTGGVKVLTTTQFDAAATTTATGTQALTLVAAAGDAAFYAYTTSTTAGTVVISSGGSSKTYFVSGLSTWAYKMNFTLGASNPLGGKFALTGTVKDAFGNDLTTELAATDLHITILGGSASLAKAAVAATTATTYKYDSATKVYTIGGNIRDAAGSQAVSLVVETAGKKAAKVTAFGDTITDQFLTINALDLATQVTALTAQVAALTADYNALAAKWNKRVANKKAPKKAVTLK